MLTFEEEHATAYHEAGHVVAGYDAGRTIISATIVPTGNGCAGQVMFSDEPPECMKRYLDQSDEKKAYALSRVLGELAGVVAHDIMDPHRSKNSADELDLDFSRTLISETVSWDDHDRYLTQCLGEAREYLRRRWDAVDRVATELIKKKTLTGREISELLG